MKNKLFLLAAICFILSISDVYSFNTYTPEQESEAAARKRRKSKKRGKRGKKDDKKMFLSVSGGLAFPIGDGLSEISASEWREIDKYSSMISTKPNTTGLGFLGDLGFSYYFTPNFGAGILARFEMLPISNIVKLDRDGDMYHMYTTTEGSSWSLIPLLIGPSVKFPLGDALTFHGRLYFGVSFINSPELTFKNSYTPDDEYVKPTSIPSVPSYSATAFSYLVGIGASYSLSESVSLMANVDFMQAFTAFSEKPQFKIDIMNITNATSFTDLQNMAKDAASSFVFNTLTFSVGVGFKF